MMNPASTQADICFLACKKDFIITAGGCTGFYGAMLGGGIPRESNLLISRSFSATGSVNGNYQYQLGKNSFSLRVAEET